MVEWSCDPKDSSGTLQVLDVLVVDDSDTDAELSMRALQGFATLRLTDGEQAVDFIRCTGLYRDRPHVLPRLVVLDLELPGVNGFDVLVELRAHHSPAELPVVMFTGSSNEYMETRCLELGANAYITKPVDFEAYAHRLREAVTRWMAPSATNRPGRNLTPLVGRGPAA